MKLHSRLVLSSLFAIPICLATGLLAQPSPPLQAPDPVASSLSALIPSGASLHDVTLEGSVEYIAGSTDVTGTITLSAISDGSSRVTMVLPNETKSESVTLSNSRLSGRRRNGNGVLSAPAAHNLMTDSAWFCPAILLQRTSKAVSARDVSLLGNVQTGGAQYLHLTTSIHVDTGFTKTDDEIHRLSREDFLIDAATGLPSLFTYQMHPDSNSRVNLPVRIEYLNYQRFAGIAIPTHIKRYLNGVLAQDIQITSATVNDGLNSSNLQIH